MSVSFENTATNRGVVTFTIGQDKIQPALDQAFNKVKKNLNAPGFRKELLHQIFGCATTSRPSSAIAAS